MHTYKLKSLIWLLLLTALSGMMNCFMLIELASSTSHHTGNIVQIALAAVERDYARIWELFLIMLLFFVAAVAMGAYLSNRAEKFKDNYDIILFIIGTLLLITNFISIEKAIYVFAFILGLLNGFFIHYGNMRVRVTHMTGYLTDAGFAFGQILKGNKAYVKNFIFSMLSMLCFMFGVMLSFIINKDAMFAMAILALMLGLYYRILLRNQAFKQFIKDQRN